MTDVTRIRIPAEIKLDIAELKQAMAVIDEIRSKWEDRVDMENDLKVLLEELEQAEAAKPVHKPL